MSGKLPLCFVQCSEQNTVRVGPFSKVASPLEAGVDGLALVVHICPDESSNIPSFFADEVGQAPQRVCAKDNAPENIASMVVTLETSHLETSLLKDVAEANILAMLVTLETSHLDISPLNNDAKENMFLMLVTLETSHLASSLLNDDADRNINAMLVTLDTSHLEMSPLNFAATSRS